MANGFEGYTNASDFPTFPTGITGGTRVARRTPEEAFQLFQSRMQPFWARRTQALPQIGSNLRARYLLSAAPGRTTGGTFQYAPQSYTDFLRASNMTSNVLDEDYYGQRQVTSAELQRRAQLAAQAAAMPIQQFVNPYAPGGAMSDPEEFRRRSFLFSQFGEGAPSSIQNQLAVANLMGTQAPGGSIYGGQIGAAMRGAIANLYNRRADVGAPREGFLNWFLSQRRGNGER